MGGVPGSEAVTTDVTTFEQPMDRAAEADNMTCFRRVQCSKAAGSIIHALAQYFDCPASKMELKNQ